jgi:hypothetical protein
MGLLLSSFAFAFPFCYFLRAPGIAIHQGLGFFVFAFSDELQDALAAALHSRVDEIVPSGDSEAGESQSRGFFL